MEAPTVAKSRGQSKCFFVQQKQDNDVQPLLKKKFRFDALCIIFTKQNQIFHNQTMAAATRGGAGRKPQPATNHHGALRIAATAWSILLAPSRRSPPLLHGPYIPTAAAAAVRGPVAPGGRLHQTPMQTTTQTLMHDFWLSKIRFC